LILLCLGLGHSRILLNLRSVLENEFLDFSQRFDTGILLVPILNDLLGVEFREDLDLEEFLSLGIESTEETGHEDEFLVHVEDSGGGEVGEALRLIDLLDVEEVGDEADDKDFELVEDFGNFHFNPTLIFLPWSQRGGRMLTRFLEFTFRGFGPKESADLDLPHDTCHTTTTSPNLGHQL
jgi:hypothetical protein